MKANEMRDNPILDIEGLPRFAAIEAQDLEPAIQATLGRAQKEVEAIEKNFLDGFEGKLAGLTEVSELLHRIWGPVSHLNRVRNSDALRSAYEKANREVVDFGVRLSQNPSIYQGLNILRSGRGWDALDPMLKRHIEIKLRDAQLTGVGLSGKDQERFKEIATKLADLSTQFSNNVLDATKEFKLVLKDAAEVEGLSHESLAQAALAYQKDQGKGTGGTTEKGPWQFTLEQSSFLPFMRNAKRRDLRKQIYLAYMTKASSGKHDNSPHITEILELRKEQARLLGYKNYCDYSLASKMAPNVDAVMALADAVRRGARSASVQELAELKAIAPEFGVVGELNHWDIAFLSERLKERKFQFTDEEIRPYFSFDQVMEGLFAIASELFGIEVIKSKEHRGLWDSDVQFYEVWEEGKRIASFYLDPYSRPENKRSGAWMDVCRTRGKFKGKHELPVAYIVCNLTPPVEGKPALLIFSEVETLFHEFGHALHHMMSKVEDMDLSGTNGVEWDAIELPSMFMENWCFHKPTLLKLGRHFESGETIPESLVEKIIETKVFQAGMGFLTQLTYLMVDLTLHGEYDPKGSKSAFEVQKEIQEKTGYLPPLAENRFICSFAHIFAGGYAAGYYSYMWAEVLACDAFSAFEEVLDRPEELRKVGRRYRDTVLAMGGAQHPLKTFEDFRGRQPNSDALLKSYGFKA